MSVKVLVIVIIVFDPYPNSYCLLQGCCCCFTCINFELWTNYPTIKITTVKT